MGVWKVHHKIAFFGVSDGRFSESTCLTLGDKWGSHALVALAILAISELIRL